MNRWKKKILYWILGDFLIELQSIDMMPDLKNAVVNYTEIQMHRNDILVEILKEIKILRVTGPG